MNIETKNVFGNINQYKFIGIYTLYVTLENYKKLVKQIRSINKEIIIIAGGPDASSRPDYYLLNNLADIVVIGEGEKTCFEILTNSNLEDINGIAYLKNNELIKNPPCERIIDIDELPFPDRGKDYYKYKAGILDSRYPSSMTLITSRGCPFNCIYCDRSVFGSKVTYRSNDNIIEEMEFLIKSYNIRTFCFFDDIFTIKKDKTLEFCNKVIEKKLNIKWKCMGRIGLMDMDLLNTMKKAGCYRIEFGIESSSPEILKKMNRKTDLDQIIDTVNATKNADIEVNANFILGFPTESSKEMQETIEFIHKINLDSILLSQFVLYPGLKAFFIDSNLPEDEKTNRYKLDSAIGRKMLLLYLRFYLKPKKAIQVLDFLFRVCIYKIIKK